MPDSPKARNCVIEVYKGINIRQVNEVKLHLSPHHFKKIIDVVESTGLSIPKVIAYSGQPCEKCRNTCVMILDKEGNSKPVKRGILPIPGGSGLNIIQKGYDKINRDSQEDKGNA